MENFWTGDTFIKILYVNGITKKQSGIYCIRNTVSGRRYVGSALNIKQRWCAHRSLLLNGIHHSKSLLRSWIKHGDSAFVFEILEIVDSPKNLIIREQFWIDEFDSANPNTGFNMSPTAGNCIGFKHSDEARANMSKARKGVPKSERGSINIANALIIKNKSQEMRNKVRASKIKLYSNPERRKQLSLQAKLGYEKRIALGLPVSFPHTEETKRKISVAKKGKMSDAQKVAIAYSNRNRPPNKGWRVFGAAVHN